MGVHINNGRYLTNISKTQETSEYQIVPAPSKGCQLNPKGWWIDTLLEPCKARKKEGPGRRGISSWRIPVLVEEIQRKPPGMLDITWLKVM